MGERIGVLRDGRIAEAGSHEALVARPAGAYRSLVMHESETPRVASAGGGS